ncbi:MAG TPA: NAD(+) synthase [Microvirga sp.]|jgi:nicotinamide-nucleotide amidase|nr:NAD(+) synthase [Microvirga sp.]
MALLDTILDLSRQAQRGSLSPWFDRRLRAQVESGLFPPESELESIGAKLVGDLEQYREQAGVSTAVLGMSGGVDSALTAALFKRAGWRVIGFTLPIEQNPEETERGVEACGALGIEHLHIDLSASYRGFVGELGALDPDLPSGDDGRIRTRRGNVRARLRMVTLYDQAHRFGGIVASTDNFSELGAGFWTLHGDVGDVAPVQSLIKSWEVPWMARAYGVPERTWRAKPTDGLGIGGGDEAQIGVSYLEWDTMVFALLEAVSRHPGLEAGEIAEVLEIGGDEHARAALDIVLRRLRGTWFKRVNPIRLDHPTAERYDAIDALDARLFRPAVLRADEALSRFSGELQDVANQLAQALKAAERRLVTAESCTAGLLAACVAGAPGSSGVLEGSFVTYCSSLKTDVLGVPAELIAEKTPYHPDVARRMAAGALERAPCASLALSVTGVGGPGPDQGKPAGLVYVGAALRGGEPVAEEHRFSGHPKQVLAHTVRAALRLGLATLEKGGSRR